jgi:hypothetical protein
MAGSMTTPLESQTTLIVESGGQNAPPCGPTTRVVEAGSPTATLTTLAPTSMPHTSATTPPAPCTAWFTQPPQVYHRRPPVASSAVPASPSATQPVPHVLLDGAVPVSPMVHPHLMCTSGANGFWQPKLYIATSCVRPGQPH